MLANRSPLCGHEGFCRICSFSCVIFFTCSSRALLRLGWFSSSKELQQRRGIYHKYVAPAHTGRSSSGTGADIIQVLLMLYCCSWFMITQQLRLTCFHGIGASYLQNCTSYRRPVTVFASPWLMEPGGSMPHLQWLSNPILSRINPFPSPDKYLFKIRSNFVLPSTPRPS